MKKNIQYYIVKDRTTIYHESPDMADVELYIMNASRFVHPSRHTVIDEAAKKHFFTKSGKLKPELTAKFNTLADSYTIVRGAEI